MQNIKQWSLFQVRPAAKIFISEFLANSVFECLLSIFALWTILSHFARIFNLSLSSLVLSFSVLLLLIGLLLGKMVYARYRNADIIIDPIENPTLITLVVLMLMGATLALGAIRPDTDDVDYTSQILYFFNHPNIPIDLLRHDHGMIDIPFSWPIYIFYSLELLCAYIAIIFHIPFLDVFYYLLPVLGGLLIPLAWFLAFTKFSRQTIIAVLAATAVCVFLSLNGSPHRSFGNFAFVRIWQGKTMLMSIMSPLFIAFIIDFFRFPTLNHWLRLVMLMIAGSGLTAMSAFYLPFLGIAGVSYWLTQKDKSIKQLALFFSSYFYLVLVAVYFKSVVNKDAIAFHGQARWPTDFVGQFKMVFIDIWSWPSFAFIFFSVLGLILAKPLERRFVLYWLFGTIALLLNPLVFPFISSHITTLNNYWRLFYLLPFPFVVGFCLIALDNKFSLPTKPAWIYSAFLGAICFTVLGNTYPNRYLMDYATYSKINFAFGDYKIYPELNSDVQQIIKTSQPGLMLAPYLYSATIPIYTSEIPQVSVRYYMISSLAAGFGEDKIEAKKKIKAIQYISGESADGLPETITIIGKDLATIIINPKTTAFSNWPILVETLKTNNFKLILQTSRFLLYAK